MKSKIRNDETTIENLRKKGKIALLLGLGYALGGYCMLKFQDSKYLNPSDFKSVEWIQVTNPVGTIWGSYMNENIHHSSTNWYVYMQEVRKMNNGNLEGDILLPDLDGDGKVFIRK